MPNVTIGENSIVAAYSFVTQDISDNELWSGIPGSLGSNRISSCFVADSLSYNVKFGSQK